MNLDLQIVGDPFWCGASDAFPDQSTVANTAAEKGSQGNVMIAFINYLPSQNVALSDGQARGRFDYFTSGVYRVTSVSSRFQGGQFSQSLTCVKQDDLTASLVKNRLERI